MLPLLWCPAGHLLLEITDLFLELTDTLTIDPFAICLPADIPLSLLFPILFDTCCGTVVGDLPLILTIV